MKQGLADQLAHRGTGVFAERIDLRDGPRAVLAVQPSTAVDLEHGFAGLAKFFVPGKITLAELETTLFTRLGSSDVFDDEYISSGGQLHELIAGPRPLRRRPARPLVDPDAFACHPYDVCTTMLLEEAGGVVTDPQRCTARRAPRRDDRGRLGRYANPALAARIGPILAELVDALPHRSRAGTPRPARRCRRLLWASTCWKSQRTSRPKSWPRTTTHSWWARAGISRPTRSRPRRAPLSRDPRRALDVPRWTHYVLGVTLVLVRHRVIDAPRAGSRSRPTCPRRSACRRVRRWKWQQPHELGADDRTAPARGTVQEAENQVVGAPCGIMDQVVVTMGRPGGVLPILCRPASVDPIVELLDDLEVVGVPPHRRPA